MENSSITIIFSKKSIKKENQIFVSEIDFESVRDYNSIRLTVNEIKKIQNSFMNGKKVFELFEYDNISLWWFFYPEIFTKLFKVINFIENFTNFIEKTKPNLVKIEDDFFYYEIIKQICESFNIKFTYSKRKVLKFDVEEKTKFKARQYKVKSIFNSKINKRLDLFSKQKSKSYSLKNKIIFSTYALYRRGIFNFEKGVTEKGEFLIQDLINLLNKENQCIGFDIFSYSFPEENSFNERLNSEMSWLPLEFFHKKHFNEKEEKKFLQKFEKIVKSKDFQNLFHYKKISFWKQISQDFHKMKFAYGLPYWIRTIYSLQKEFVNDAPKAVFLIYETGPQSLAIIAACHKLGIKTIGIQHGMIHDYHPYYLHGEFLSSKHTLGFPFPDNLLLFGNIPKDILEKNGYPKNQLIVLGNPTFFNLGTIQKYLKKESIYEKYHLENNKKIILYLSSGFQLVQKSKKPNFDIQVWKYLVEKFGDNDKISIIFKPHPHEKHDIFQKFLDKNKSSNLKIIQGNLLELIHISSAVISITSTSLIDSMCFNKPAIQLLFDRTKFTMPYDEYEAVLKSKLNNLDENIQKIIQDVSLRQKLIEQEKEFVKNYYNIGEQNPEKIIKKIFS